MRKIVFLALALLTVLSAVLTLPKAEATGCHWTCGPCGPICPCSVCGPPYPPCHACP